MNMIVGKRQIVLAALVLCLSIAVYLNWQYSDVNHDLLLTNKTEEVKNYGDAQYVENIDEGQSAAFFAEAKLTRQKSRDEAVETMKSLIESDSITSEQRTELALKTSAMATAIEQEGKIENLIKAKGFEECMVYYDTERVDVMVKTEGLEPQQVAQMKDIIIKEVDIQPENISIIEVK
ncbi:MAG TPA: SpoIIIAH-like family protein [Candidatus Fimivivens faecavium]|nr:SpoIIIAH-like family protein [Candidatus Fimivivens faecavium]